MAFTQNTFTCVFTGNGFSMWQYRSTTDALATIRASGYFNSQASVINTGDALWIGPDSTNAAGGWDMFINTSGVITVAAPTLLAADTPPHQAQKAPPQR